MNSSPLPPLRVELDVMPSPVPERPGLLIRDPFQFSDATIVVPPLLAQALALFDGEHSELDLRAYLTRVTGDLQTGEAARHLIDTLDQCGFLESQCFFEMRETKRRAFELAPVKEPAHAGSAYPDQPEALAEQFNGWGVSADGAQPASRPLIGLAAPHVSPVGGYQSYAAAYRRLRPEHAAKTFIILGTSHYGQPETFGLTRKPYETPLGRVETDAAVVDRLAAAAPTAVEMEDYCHASEHSIEFQTVFLQHVLGPHLPDGERLRAVPILCGSFFESLLTGKPPEANEDVLRFFEALGELAAQREDLIWVLGIDLAHIGRRYGDSFEASADEGPLAEVRRRDEERLARVTAGDSAGYYELVRPNRDDLRWCGYSAIYTFLKSAPSFTGEVLRYEQWNIDEASVVSFTAAEFRAA